ncbi:FAD/NAD(P)-binding domain-containing protein [Nocardiopsis sp. MG754419]|uniref:FAD/NAD(P)-binding protein n=1 Tax=Nocardiopsis sp. MG754419 TaxID=2259865 RepID=UPI001BACDBD6|nr:FAD/NAD(P)-binding protein [Nocardiopsis sp. MG754419]MBR8743262.1 adenylate cyclase [Nocardiopsis sp. MG754419]
MDGNRRHESPPRPRRIAIVGVGPRGTSLFERLLANADPCAPGLPLEIHLIDPFPPGGGRIWRSDQSPLLWMNTRPDECTVFLDASVRCAGPVRPGPSLAEWARDLAEDRLDPTPGYTPGAAARAEAARVDPAWFATRALQGEYLSWALWTLVARADPRITVHVHPWRAASLSDLEDGGQRLVLENDDRVDADVVLLAQGICDNRPTGRYADLADHAERRGFVYAPPSPVTEGRVERLDGVDGLRPGEPVLLRGLGLAFVDYLVLLTQGRGGAFHREASGELRYTPSGREPLIHAGSRRGVPYLSKLGYRVPEDPEEHPARFTRAAVDALGEGTLDFTEHLRPLIRRELEDAAYRHLALNHPGRLSVDARTFLDHLAAFPVDDDGGGERKELIEEALLDPRDRVDLDRIEHPLAGLWFPTLDGVQGWMSDHLDALVRRRGDGAFSADLALYRAVVRSSRLIADLAQQERLEPGGGEAGRPVTEFLALCRFITSGPPLRRAEEMLALARAGVLRFLGAGVRVEATDEGFLARSATTGATVLAGALVEAHIEGPDVRRTTDPLLEHLVGREEVRRDGGRVAARADSAALLRPDGAAHPARFGAGAVVGHSLGNGAFAAPGRDAPALRQNDAIARNVLRALIDDSA